MPISKKARKPQSKKAARPQQKLKPSARLREIVGLLNEFEQDFSCLDTYENSEFFEACLGLESFNEALALEGF
jgi:hypothetical protein